MQITLHMTPLQEEAVKAFWAHNDWNYEADLVASQDDVIDMVPATNSSSDVIVQAIVQEPPPLGPEAPNIPPIDGANECQHCYCTPCVTTFPQGWLGNGQQARPGNNLIRKDRYKKFWSMLKTRGAWLDERYLLKKERCLREDGLNPDTVFTLREVMPLCVLALVRGLYPNPVSVPYQGHNWR